MQQTTNRMLQARQDTPRVLTTAEELLNSMSLQTNSNVNSPVDDSKRPVLLGSGYNSGNRGSISPKHDVFVLSRKGEPLTPTTPRKARKLMQGKQAVPIWNKFSQFGIQMLVETGREHPKTCLGVDNGTKFEGYAIITGKENNLAVMWKLPDKKKIMRKLEERRQLRRARRLRNCRRRECRFNNRARKGFIAPSQKVIILSRLKAIKEFFKCYPIDVVAIEDVKFNHSKKHYGKNFSTIEIGKIYLYNLIMQKSGLQMFTGIDTGNCRDKYGYKKSSDKSAEVFNAHCSDALAIATDVFVKENIEQGKFIVVDDTYRPIKRKLHDSQFSKGNIRYPFLTKSLKKVRKGTICEYGLISGEKKHSYSIYPFKVKKGKEKRIRIVIRKIGWLSHNFKICGVSKCISASGI